MLFRSVRLSRYERTLRASSFQVRKSESRCVPINVELKNSEWKVYKVEREEGTSNVYRSTWVQDYMDANNFTLDVFLCGASYQAVTDWPSVGCVERDDPLFREYEEVVLTAARELDPEKVKQWRQR